MKIPSEDFQGDCTRCGARTYKRRPCQRVTINPGKSTCQCRIGRSN